MDGANNKNQDSFGQLDAEDEVKSSTGPKVASSCLTDLRFKSYQRDPLARLIIDRLRLTPFRFALVMVGATALFYALAAALIAAFYTSGDLVEFLLWARRSWAHLILLLIPPTIMGFYCWINIATGHLFDGLAKDNVVEVSNEKLHEMVLGGKGSIKEAYNRSAWGIVSMFFTVFIVVLTVVRPGFGQGEDATGSHMVLFAAIMLPFNAFLIYTVSMMVAKVIITIRSLGKLFSHTTLNLRPLHPDRCGGLRRLQDYTMIVNYAIAVAGFGLSLLVYLSFKAGHLATDYHLYVFLGGYVFLAPYCFFATLGTAHQAMKTAKESFLHNISEQFQGAYAEMQERLTSKHGELRDNLDKIEQLQTFHKLTQSFPIWPFDVRSIRRFAAMTATPLLWMVVAAVIDKLL